MSSDIAVPTSTPWINLASYGAGPDQDSGVSLLLVWGKRPWSNVEIAPLLSRCHFGLNALDCAHTDADFTSDLANSAVPSFQSSSDLCFHGSINRAPPQFG